MTRKTWHWDVNLPEAKIKKILSREDDYRFPRIAGTLLSRVDDPEQVFKLITPVAFCRRWRAIENEIKSDEWTKEKAAFWKTTYIKLSKEFRDKGEKIRKVDEISLDESARDLIKKIKESRRKALLSQKELAELMGCSQQYISGIEKGREKISLDFLQKFTSITNEPLENFPLKKTASMPERRLEPVYFQSLVQGRIYQNLLLIGPGSAASYRDACRLMNEKEFATRTHLVAHLLREIESGLLAVLTKMANVALPCKNDSGDGHKKKIKVVLEMFEISLNEPVSETWLATADALSRFTHRKALDHPRPVDDAFMNLWTDMETVFDVILGKFREKFLIHLDILDDLASEVRPTQDDLQELRNTIPNNPVSLGYFLEKCQSPQWLDLLSVADYFKNPPAQRDGDGIQFSFWPQSRYLVRMAGTRPEKVSEIMCAIPETDNPWVHVDLIDAALGMPADFSAAWVKKEIEWLAKQSHFSFFLPEKFGLLISHLSKGGQVEVALDVARALLSISADSETGPFQNTDDTSLMAPRLQTLFDRWDYEKIIEKNIPDLVKSAGLPVLDFLCGLLSDAVRFSRRSEDDGPEDYSYIWRQSIENDIRDHSRSVEGILVSGVRDAAESLIKTNIVDIKDVIRTLEQRKWNIFQRIILYILKVFADQTLEFAAARLTDRSLFEDGGVRCEYARLLNRCFNHLQPEQQRIILDWIEKGPDLEEFKRSSERLTGKRPTDEEAERYLKYWQRNRLAWFKDQLPEDWKKQYENLVVELGEPNHPEFASYMGDSFWTGPISPVNADELSQMALPELIDFLKTWRPKEDRRASSVEGFGRILEEVAKREPERFSREAQHFKAVHPTYVRSLISGLTNALKDKKKIECEPVLNLCQWVVNQPRDIIGAFSGFSKECDPGWGWTRGAVARFLSEGLNEDIFSLDQRMMIWNIIVPVTEDPDPAVKNKDTNMDPATLSINSVRGEAMHAVIRYALWVRRHIEKLPDAKERLVGGFEEMKEVRGVLEKHLDVKNDPSLAIRTVYGQWMPLLVFIDSKWARNNVSRIFPTEKSMRSYYDAAWETYIIDCDAYDNVFPILKKQYERAVESFDKNQSNERKMRSNERLAEHLMILYWRGFFKIDDSENIFSRFWNQAPEKLKAHAVEFIGRRLYHTKDEAPSQILQRLKDLWDHRLKTAAQAELSAFGWWFVSKKFDNEWALAQLQKVLEKTGHIEPDSMVVERLAELVVQMPEETVKCLSLIIYGDSSGWGFYGWRDAAKTILRQALQTAAVSQAKSVIHYLGSQGHLEFRELLPEASTH